mgnify:CR=1 FL=1
MIDTGFKASEVYRFCLATGWKAMKGDDAEWFLSQDPRTRKTVKGSVLTMDNEGWPCSTSIVVYEN